MLRVGVTTLLKGTVKNITLSRRHEPCFKNFIFSKISMAWPECCYQSPQERPACPKQYWRRAGDSGGSVVGKGTPGSASNDQRLGPITAVQISRRLQTPRNLPLSKLANDGQDTRAIQHYLGHRNIQHTTRYTELAADRF